MLKRVCVSVLLIVATACGKGDSTTPSSPTPTATTFSLTGRVTNSAASTGIAGAVVSIADSANIGKSATTDSSGNYSFTDLQQATLNVNATASGYVLSSKSVTLTSNQTLNFALAPQSLAGSWSGAATVAGSAAALPVTFTVNSSNQLTALQVIFQLGGSCVPVSFNVSSIAPGTPLAITNNSFTATDPFVTTISGTFTSASLASGTATIKWPGQSFEPAACKGTFNLTWTATNASNPPTPTPSAHLELTFDPNPVPACTKNGPDLPFPFSWPPQVTTLRETNGVGITITKWSQGTRSSDDSQDPLPSFPTLFRGCGHSGSRIEANGSACYSHFTSAPTGAGFIYDFTYTGTDDNGHTVSVTGRSTNLSCQ